MMAILGKLPSINLLILSLEPKEKVRLFGSGLLPLTLPTTAANLLTLIKLAPLNMTALGLIRA